MHQNLLRALRHVAETQSCRFASITYRAKETGEVARHTILLGVNQEKVCQTDLATYRRHLASLYPVRHQEKIKVKACRELIASLRDTLRNGEGNNKLYTCKGVYRHIKPGIKRHIREKTYYVSGFSLRKKVLQPGVHKVVKSSEKTIEKAKIAKTGKRWKYRQFIINPKHVKAFHVTGKAFAVKTV